MTRNASAGSKVRRFFGKPATWLVVIAIALMMAVAYGMGNMTSQAVEPRSQPSETEVTALCTGGGTTATRIVLDLERRGSLGEAATVARRIGLSHCADAIASIDSSTTRTPPRNWRQLAGYRACTIRAPDAWCMLLFPAP
jgi:hypothetical protein